MFAISYNLEPFLQNLTDIEKRQLPFALSQALNDAMFAVRKGWMDAIPRVFDRPTPLTTKAILYRKATKDNLVAEVYFRNEATKGTPPAAYLISEVEGGARQPKPFERILRAAGIIGGDEFAVPAKGQPLDQFGNIPGGVTNAMLSDLQASREVLARSTSESRGKRAKRNRKREGQGVYFVSRGKGGGQPLPRGIYERSSRAFVGPRRGGAGQSGARMVFAIVKQPVYGVRFDARALAQDLFDKAFPTAFQIQFARAVLNARPRG